MFPLDDTIAAIATASRNGERGILRLSGPNVIPVVRPWFECSTPVTDDWFAAKSASVFPGNLRLEESREMPCDLYVWPTKQSYTRQPSIELHTLGNRPLLELVLRNVCTTGARLANPGEFTLRAFLSGRLDLAQAEAVLGVIDAQGDDQFQTALNQLAGGISNRLNDLRDTLLNLCADIEAGLDFVEEDIEFVSSEEVDRRLRESVASVQLMQRQMQLRNESDRPPVVSLSGPPNVGKSSLLNSLVGRDSAIVSPVAGTTRDYVSVITDFAGLSCELVDTAGIEKATVGPAAEAQAKTVATIARARLRLFCFDLSKPLSADCIAAAREIEFDILVGTKADLATSTAVNYQHKLDVETSCETGVGLDRLREIIAERLAADSSYASETVGPTAVRCLGSLNECETSLSTAMALLQAEAGEELVAAELRTTLEHLGQVVGTIYTDDILDRVFSRFCIGK